jgi:hypothetical protein
MKLDYVLILCTNSRFNCEQHWEGLRDHLKRKIISTSTSFAVRIYSRIMKIEMMVYMIRHPIQSDFQHYLVGLELLTRRLNTLIGSSEIHYVKHIRSPRQISCNLDFRS